MIRKYPRTALFVFAFVARGVFVLWAQKRFPAAADGTYYDILARRIQEGAGYTWRWPDGVVTFAAHYPVGYPALLAVTYKVLGASAGSGMWMNALLTATVAPAAYELAGGARRGTLAGIVVAVHPALVPYTAALMTEGVVTALLAATAALALRRERWALWTLGAVFGLMTLMRPQMLLLAPVFGAIAMRERGWWKGALVAGGLAVLVCLPWTVRNCRVMDQCTFVSANGGTNLLIGSESTTGGWHEVPKGACPEVFGEVAKDVCFGKVARASIRSAPLAFLAKVPKKLSQTFDYFGAGPYYLHASNPEAFSYEAKVKLGAAETLFHRATLLAGLLGIAIASGNRKRTLGVRALAGVGAFATFLPMAAVIAHAAAAFAWLLRDSGRKRPLLFASVVLSTAIIHAVFFGAGRYGLPLVPFVVAFAFRPANAEAACAPGDSLS